jgi:hypothetical protein
MLGFIKNIFGNADALIEAGKSGKSQEFVSLFLTSELTLLSLPVAESLDATNLTEKELLDLVENAAQQVSQQTEVNLFTFEDGTTTVLPVFTSDKAAQKFVEQYVSQVQKIIPFQVLGLKGETLLNFLSEDAKVVLNPKNPSEYRLTKKDITLLIQTGGITNQWT